MSYDVMSPAADKTRHVLLTSCFSLFYPRSRTWIRTLILFKEDSLCSFSGSRVFTVSKFIFGSVVWRESATAGINFIVMDTRYLLYLCISYNINIDY